MLQLLQRRRRLQAELVVEPPAEPVVRGERLGLAAGAVEGEHELAVRRLAQRVGGDDALELRDRVGVAAEREPGLDPLLPAREPELLEVRGLDARERLVELGERRAPPQAQRLLEQRRRLLGVARGERGAAPLPQAAEADRVDALGRRRRARSRAGG